MKRPLFLTFLLSYLLLAAVVVITAAVAPATIVAGILGGIACAFVLAAITTARITLPIDRLKTGLRRLSAGDFGIRVATERPERMLGIAPLFDEAAERTGQLVAELQRQEAAFNSILSSVREALVVLDNEGRVALANSSFKKMVGTEEVRGMLYWELLRDPDFINLVGKAGGECRQQNIEIAGRTYAASATRVPQTHETVVTFHDITDIVNTERVKRELVLNAAHELRTPLTAVRGYVETMEPLVGAEGRHCLAVVRRHTDRLAKLVQDIATLAELEEPGLHLDLERLDLRHLAAEVVQMFSAAANSKRLALSLKSTDEPLTVKADRFRIEQVLMNLIDNAIRYTEKGSVTVKLSRQNDRALIEVVDTGPGIESHHLPRLFERFYVVDRSRSRQTGGTGLGLSIVRHIVLLHGGEVSVNSTLGAGTSFTVTLPISPDCPDS